MYDFDQIIDRQGTNSVKHDLLPEPDVLPMWVADMDFRTPDVITQALQERVAHGVFGYTMPWDGLKAVLCQRMADLYDWHVQPEQIVILPGVVSGFNIAVRAFTGDVLVQPPLYPPMLGAPGNHGVRAKKAHLVPRVDGPRLHYEIDFDAFAEAIDENTATFLLCNPHNPTGRVWTPNELTRMAEICIERDVVICSDEIHADFVFDGRRHVPLASLAPEIARRTITLMAPSKTFNIPSLGFAFAIITDDDLRERYQQAEHGIVPHPGVLGMVAAQAAYEHGGEWLAALIDYLQANRDFTTQYIEANMPGIHLTHPEGTYLTWLDCRNYLPEAQAAQEGMMQWINSFFHQQAQVALNDGKIFDAPGFARLNFATPRSILEQALGRMAAAISEATARA